MSRRFLAAASLASVLGMGLALTATGAQAVPSRHVQYMRINSHSHGSGPNRGRTTNMTYHGGQVETAPSIYLDFWGSWWNTTTTTGSDGSFSYTNSQAMTYIEDFYTNVGGSAWDGINTQYCQGVANGTVNCGSSGTHVTNPSGQLKSVLVDTTSVPSNPSQSQIASEAATAAGKFGLAGASQVGATIVVLTPPGNSENGFGTQWCAWHSVTTYNGGNLPYAYLPYQPAAGTSCGENFINQPDSYGNGYFDGFSVVGGHEYAEAVTDPVTASGGYAWYDGSGNEIGDKCAWSSGSGNITLGSHYYAVQPLWSNQNSGCVL